MASLDEVFSVVALFILFRETVEASIVCGVLLQFLNRSKPRLKSSGRHFYCCDVWPAFGPLS